MNKKLRQLNQEILTWAKNLPKKEGKYAKPYLIKVSSEYIRASIKVLIVAKETNGWETKPIEKGWDEITVDDLMEHYDNFVNKEWGYSEHDNHRSAVWEFVESIRTISEGSNKLYPQYSGILGTAATNIALLGYYEEGMPGCDESLKKELAYFSKRQIEILNPDIILFTFAHIEKNKNYTDMLELIFGNIFDFNNILNSKTKFTLLATLERGVKRPLLIFNSYHPIYYRRKGIISELVEQFTSEIMHYIEQINVPKVSQL